MVVTDKWQVVGGTEVTNLEPPQAEINIHLSMMSALSIYTVLMRTNSPKQPGCLHVNTINSFEVFLFFSFF